MDHLTRPWIMLLQKLLATNAWYFITERKQLKKKKNLSIDAMSQKLKKGQQPEREIKTRRSPRGEIEATSPSNLQRKQRQSLKGKTRELFILNDIILVVEGILSMSKPDSERQVLYKSHIYIWFKADTGAVKCVNRTVYAVFVDSEKAFWNHCGKSCVTRASPRNWLS